jgi:hypothetical protein
MNSQYRQVTCKRDLTGSSFPGGVQRFEFSIGGKTVWVPAKSYFRIGLKLAVGGVTPAKTDNVTFANLAPGGLFNNVAFLAGNEDVSKIQNYAPQAHACNYRLTKSGAWLNSIGRDAYGYSPNFDYRRFKSSEIEVSDIAIVSPEQDLAGQADTYFLYQPPIGIMEYNKPMASGSYVFEFNPNSNYQTACVQTIAGAAAYTFEVTSMELYYYSQQMDVSPSGLTTLHLMESNVQSKPLGGAGEKNFDFTVPASTKALSVFIQSGAAGANPLIPPSNFKCSVGTDLATGLNAQDYLKGIQITYGNITKPPTRWTSDFSLVVGSQVFKLNQRYLDTQIESGRAFSPGGCETMQEWLTGGVLLHWDWTRDANDRSTNLQMQIDYGQFEAGSNVFVIAHYSKQVDIEINNGYISSVTSLTV